MFPELSVAFNNNCTDELVTFPTVAVKLIGISYRKAGNGWHFEAFGPDYKHQSNQRPVLKLTNENKWKIIQFYENTFILNSKQSNKIIKLITAMIIENQAELM